MRPKIKTIAENKSMAKADQNKGELEPEIEEFLSLLARIAARVLTNDGAERENSPKEIENESGSIPKG